MIEDKEIIDEFIEQLKGFSQELSLLLKKTTDLNSSAFFEQCGQIVDRVFGAISMFGLTEFSSYTRTIKELCYKCSRSDNETAHQKSTEILQACSDFLMQIAENFGKPEELKKLNFNINLDLKRAEKIIASYLFSIKEASVKVEADSDTILVFDKTGLFESECKETKKVFFPTPSFFSITSGFNKALVDDALTITGIIINCDQMPAPGWLEILKSCVDQMPTVPVILTAKKFEDLGNIDRSKLGIRELLPTKLGFTKIFSRLKTIQKQNVFSMKEELEVDRKELFDADFIEVSASSFKLSSNVAFDLYLKVAARYIKVLSAGDAFDEKQLSKHAEKGVRKYYIKADIHEKYLANFEEEMNRLLSSTTVPLEIKQTNFSELGKDILRSIEKNGFDSQMVEMASNYAQKTGQLVVELMTQSEDYSKLLSNLKLLEHAVAVSMIGSLFLNHIKATQCTHDDIVFACFVHDLGLLGTSGAAQEEDVRLMNEEDKKYFWNHPRRGADILQKQNVKNALVEAIAHHHMRLDGTGFPEIPKGTAFVVNRIGELIGLSEEIVYQIKINPEFQIADLRPSVRKKFSPSIQKAFDLVFN